MKVRSRIMATGRLKNRIESRPAFEKHINKDLFFEKISKTLQRQCGAESEAVNRFYKTRPC